MQGLIALEIIEQSNEKIVTKDFLSMTEVSIEDLLRKIDIMLRSIFSELPSAIKEDLSEIIVEKEIDINRLNYLALRAIRTGLSNPQYAKIIKKNSLELFELWNIVAHLEKISDEVRDISKMLVKNGFNDKERRFINGLFNDLQDLYLGVMKAYYDGNTELAYKMTVKKRSFINNTESQLSKEKCNTKFSQIADRVVMIAKSINNIARRVYS